MPIVKVLYATRIGFPGWHEQVITDKSENIEDALAWCLANNFDRVRIAQIDLSLAPNFNKTLSV